ncbi:Na+/H+ antiporter subunit E [Mycobacterium simiae]|uniref:Na+/H+ antiporter subunit E n=1 Tax=Mycobacterium simiae TaxID=1784 RepID=A0A5B1BQZ0_MYCSI|nr:Na+/H+ antiporter subunit E [Mycobacterium simiae]
MRAVLRRVTVLIALMAVWQLLWGDYSVATAISGLLVAAAITTLLSLPAVPVQGRLHPVSLVRLIARVGWYLLVSSVQVSWLAIRPSPPPPAAVLRVQLSVKSDLVLVLAANIMSLLPGSISLEIDQVRRVMFCHVIDAGSPRAVAAFYRQVTNVERLLVAAFERDAEWLPAPTEEQQ